MTAKNQQEIARRFRVLKQMLDMHSHLRDSYFKRALILDLALLLCSIVFCALTFVSDSWYGSLGLTPERAKLVLGFVSVLCFFAALAELLVGWKQRSNDHAIAAKRLGVVMAEFRAHRLEDGSWTESKHGTLKKEYDQAMAEITPIPDSKFLSLKSRHLRKVEISKVLDEYPGRSILLAKLILFYHSNFGKEKTNDSEEQDASDSQTPQ